MGEALKTQDARISTFIPFHRIKGLSDRRRVPVIGRIKLGVRVNGKDGLYPKETPYFVVPSEVEHVYGPKPTELDIIFVSDEETKMFPQALKLYGENQLLKCIGNGEQASRLNERFKWEPRACTCEFYDQRKCRARANLMVMLPKVGSGGLYQIDTGNQDSIPNINSYLEFLYMTFGRIANIPLKLRRVPLTRRRENRSETHYPLVLRYEGTLEESRQLKQETATVLKKLKSIEIQDPLDINPAADTDAKIVAEEDLPEVMTLSSTQATNTTTTAQEAQQTESELVQPTPSTTGNSPADTTSLKAAHSTLQGNAMERLEPKEPKTMSQAQFDFLCRLAGSMKIPQDQVTEHTQGYTIKQASNLINQLQAGDFSAFDIVKEEEIVLPAAVNSTTPLPTPPPEGAEF